MGKSAGGRLGGLIAVCLGFAPEAAHATGWIVTIGGRAAASPPYEGAPNDDIRPSVSFSVRRADRPYRFTPPDDGSSIALIASKYLDFGPVVRFRYDRDDTGRLRGFDKIDFAVEPGLFVNVWPANWLRGRVEVRRGVLGHDGWVSDAGIDLIHTGRKWDMSIGPRIGYGDRRYIDTYFGVTPQEALRSPFLFLPYEPAGGVRYGGAEAAVSYHFTNRLRTTFDLNYHRLVKLAADSPVVAIAGSRDQFAGGIGVTYSFGVNIGRRH
jgi:outer membrane scaffolding protein for murein synthesis (MipA/OmpV family)